MKQLLFAICLLALALGPEASELTGKVVSVSDGDTLRVLVGDQQIKIRLGGIDAPESDQPFGQSSKRYLAEAVAGQTAVVEFEKKDRYGRVIGKVLLDGADMNLNRPQFERTRYNWSTTKVETALLFDLRFNDDEVEYLKSVLADDQFFELVLKMRKSMNYSSWTRGIRDALDQLTSEAPDMTDKQKKILVGGRLLRG